uniref:Capsid protein n=1 Tax=Cressdnaviricota sp. TaxID=2748378 RepID=A0A6M9Z724_9VIRU|nr:MAG: capsid protein [Cressdnaviricota sp.]
MARVKRRYSSRRYTRKRYRIRKRKTSKTRRSRRTTSSRLIKLTTERTWITTDNGTDWKPFQFSLTEVTGFMDYKNVFSEFRIVKARLELSKPTDVTHALIVPSRNFAGPKAVADNVTDMNQIVPPQQENALRQTRWQKERYFNLITNKMATGFYPYTMVGTYGPASTSGFNWLRVWNTTKWMPYSWVDGTNIGTGLTFFGPYIVLNTATNAAPQADAYRLPATLTLYVKFRGQK